MWNFYLEVLAEFKNHETKYMDNSCEKRGGSRASFVLYSCLLHYQEAGIFFLFHVHVQPTTPRDDREDRGE